jgi:hypothetical protein
VPAPDPREREQLGSARGGTDQTGLLQRRHSAPKSDLPPLSLGRRVPRQHSRPSWPWLGGIHGSRSIPEPRAALLDSPRRTHVPRPSPARVDYMDHDESGRGGNACGSTPASSCLMRTLSAMENIIIRRAHSTPAPVRDRSHYHVGYHHSLDQPARPTSFPGRDDGPGPGPALVGFPGRGG